MTTTQPDSATTRQAIMLERGRRVIQLEGEALAESARRLDERFARAVELIASSAGRVIVAGVGKSGLIGRKIAATFTSTGTPATFLHPVDSVHGDLGIVGDDDVAILISKSGETEELVGLLQHLKRFGVRTIAITGVIESTLARHAEIALDAWVREEACPHDLAPTTSTTAALAIGDALAVALLEARGFTSQDFARSHPGGALGRKLLLHVADVMRTGDDLPIVSPDARLAEGLVIMSKKGLGMCVVAEGGRMLGVFTDGDLRRALDRRIDVHLTSMREVMISPGKSVRPQELAAEAAHLMEKHSITALPVVESGALVGALNVHDLLRAGVL